MKRATLEKVPWFTPPPPGPAPLGYIPPAEAEATPTGNLRIGPQGRFDLNHSASAIAGAVQSLIA